MSQKNNNKYISLNKADKENQLNKHYYDNLVAMSPTMLNEQNYNDIDENVYNLEYDPVKILSSNGEKIENFRPAEGFDNPDKYIVVKREKKSISDSTADIAVIDSTVK